MPNSVEIWQEIRDNYSSAVIFGKTSVQDGFAKARRQGQPARRSVLRVADDDERHRRHGGHDWQDNRPRRRRGSFLGRQPLGTLFAAPYAVFLAAMFAYPLGLAVWISFHDYFFAAPGAQVAAAVRRVRQLQGRPDRPGGAAVLPARRRVPGHQRAAHRGARRWCWPPR